MSRITFSSIAILFTILVLLFGSSCSPKKSALIPLEVLLGNPEKSYPQISPDGTMMAYIAPVDNVLNVWVKTIGTMDDRPVTKDKNRGIRRYFWAGDDRHIMYLQDLGWKENWRLYSVDLETGEISDLTPFEDVQVQIVKNDKNLPGELIIAMNKEDTRAHDVYHLDINSGELSMVAKNPGNAIDWVVDANLVVRGMMVSTPDGGFDLMVRKNPEAEWVQLLHWDHENSLTSYPIAFSKDGKSLHMIDSRNANARRLVTVDIATGKLEVIAEDPTYDVGEVMINPDTQEIQAVSFFRERNEWTVLDESIRDDFENVSALDHGDFYIYNRNDADDTWLVGFTADDGPVSYYAYDRRKKKGTFLFYHRPVLNDYTLAKMEPVSYTSRDGLTIHGYITYPPGKGRTGLPVVLFVHGGPWTRDIWRFNPEVQWLANRGYVCLQVNYRGSTGYGKDFLNAGDREWGGKMQDDLVDGVYWAIAEGIADPDRIAIYGNSVGGYAALVGAASSPDVFCCAVDVGGPPNLITFLKSLPAYWTPYLELFHRRVGDPETDVEFLKSRSPLFKADQIRMPLFIAQGENDPWVSREENEQIVDIVRGNGIECEFMLFPEEGHSFAKPESRLKLYAAAEKFLAKHLNRKMGSGDQ